MGTGRPVQDGNLHNLAYLHYRILAAVKKDMRGSLFSSLDCKNLLFNEKTNYR